MVFGGQHPPSDKPYGDALRLAADGAGVRWAAAELTSQPEHPRAVRPSSVLEGYFMVGYHDDVMSSATQI